MAPGATALIVRSELLVCQHALAVDRIVDMQVVGDADRRHAVQNHEMPASAAPPDTGADDEAFLELTLDGAPGDRPALHADEVVGAGERLVEIPGNVAGARHRRRAAGQPEFLARHLALGPGAEDRIAAGYAGGGRRPAPVRL